MNETSSHTSRNPGASSPWVSFLSKASGRLSRRRIPAATTLWGRPEDSGGSSAGLAPHGDAIQAVLSRYATALGVPLSFRAAGSRYSPAAAREAVHVHAFALPTPPVLFGAWPRIPLVSLRFGHGVPLKEGAQWALAAGTQLGRGRLLWDEDGQAVGEFVGTNLYCLFDLLGQEAAWVPLLLRRHLDLGLPHVLPSVARERAAPVGFLEDRLRQLREETAAALSSGRVTLRQRAREAYISACRDRLAEEIGFLQAEIAFLEEGVEEVARRITADTRRLMEGRRRLHLLQGSRERPESSTPELERLRTLPEVREVCLLDGQVSITTVPILVEHGGRWYRLGSFRLDLGFTGEVRITNLTHRIGPFDHPHVREGKPCLSSIRQGIAKLVGEFQFVAAAEVLIDFLKTVNPMEWRLPVLHWPEAGGEAPGGVLATA